MAGTTLARRSVSFLLALGLPLLTLGIKLYLDSYIGHAVPFLLFHGAIILVAWRCGQNFGILTALWSGLLASVAFLFQSPGTDLARLFQLLLFTCEGTFIAVVTARWRTAQDELSARARRHSALAEISGLGLGEANDFSRISKRASAICTQIMGGEHVLSWLGDGAAAPASPPEDAFFLSVLEAGRPVTIPRFDNFVPAPPDEWRKAQGGIAVPIGDREHPFGVLLSFSDGADQWGPHETEFLASVGRLLTMVAQRTTTEQLRRREETRYRAFVEQSSEAIWCCEFTPPIDLSRNEDEVINEAYACGRVTECNDAFAHMYGFSNAQELVGTRLSDLLVRDDPSNVEYLRAFFQSDYRLNDARSVETDREGKRVEFSNNLIGITENDRMLRVWGTQRDISAEQEANIRLRASEARFRALFDAAPVAIAITRDGVLLYVNQAAVTLLGCESEWEMIGHPVNEFVAPVDREMMQKRIAQRTQAFEGPLVYEATSLRRDGTTRPFRIEVSPLDLPDGPATLAFAFDLTQEKAAEAQRQQLLDTERRSAHRATRLQEITASLAATTTLTSEEVARIIITQGVEALQASAGALCEPRYDANGAYLVAVASVGYSNEILEKYGRFPLDSTLPAVLAYRENRPFWQSNQEEMLQAHPVFAESVQHTSSQALAALPLEVEGHVLGVLSVSFATPQEFDAETRAFMLTLAGQCAQALDRVRLFNEVRHAARMEQESLALLNTLLASAPIGIAVYDLNGRHVLLNEALSQLDGVPLIDHLGKTPSEVLPLINGEMEEIIARVIRDGEAISQVEYMGPTRMDSEEIHHLLLSFYPVRVGEGEISGVGGMVLDVTARTRTERERAQLMVELESERARFEAILQQMPSAVIIAEAPGGRFILGNPQVESVFRAPYKPLEGIDDYAKIHCYRLDGTEIGPHEWPLARAIELGQVSSGEQVVVTRGDGSTGILRMNAAPIRDREGAITAGVAIFDDVTQSARADNAQRFLAEAGSALLSTLDEGQIYERLVQLCVPRIADWCIVVVPGDDNVPTQVAIKHADPDKVGAAQSYRARLASTKELPWNPSLRGKKSLLLSGEQIDHFEESGGSSVYARLLQDIDASSVIMSPLGARGRTLGVMLWITAESERTYDSSDRDLADELARRTGLTADGARLYKESQVARDEAENANRAKDEFLAVVSHELRTPLTPILGWLELLRSPSIDDVMRGQAYNVIERNARAQAQLVNDILDVSRITTGKLRMELKRTDVASLVENAVESLRTNADSQSITLELAIDDVGEADIDVNRIQQVVWNLLQNAIKFTQPGGRISVSLVRNGETARLQITDSGVGIRPDFLPYVFDRFRQADSSSTRKAGGLGLGLAIVYHIVEAHGGHATAWSEGEGKGATFTVELPLLPQTATSNGSSTKNGANGKSAQAQALEGINIVVTDDEPDTREMMRVLLTTHGAQVRAAGSAQETLDIIKSEAPDILISDIGMPFVDGYELRRELKLRGFQKPSIALTAYTAATDAQRALEAGFNAHLSKPVDAASLLATIQQLVQNEPA